MEAVLHSVLSLLPCGSDVLLLNMTCAGCMHTMVQKRALLALPLHPFG